MANTIIGKKGFLRKSSGWECSACGEKFGTRKLLQVHKHETSCGQQIKKLGYKKRDEILRRKYANGELHGSFKGKHHTKSSKEKMSKKAVEHSYWEHRSRNPIIYESPIAGKMNLDSYWELTVAKRLDSMNVTWYRPKLSLGYIDNKGQKRYYCPDFFVKDYVCFLEVKSPYISKRQNVNGKIDYIKSHYDFIQWIESEEECNTFVLQNKNYSDLPEKLVENFEHKVRARQIAKENKVDKRTYRDDFINLKNKRWNIIQESNIDFTKYGWVKEIANLFGIAENKAGKYIKKNFPDFYKNCYVRKNTFLVA